ncbi:WG repeat-containing protein [Chondrinema litorale]|uniref:WG repeat-containing protein n=1 Tax=Chondrinema litorale TaxID=2994555 RepID=UPI002542BF04|nr:WG repeat-containing protein [Chondrinema litorale]UZR99531.1 WG repeat-containing protein [Chondrinema litorale]
MKALSKLFIPLFFTLILIACKDDKDSSEEAKQSNSALQEMLIRLPIDYEMGDEFCYVNAQGDTVIPVGKFLHSFSDTIIDYGVVVEQTEGSYDLIAINPKGERLYKVYLFDNGPDYLIEGMFRIVKNDKIGFADSTGAIVIEPQFACAYQFSDGKAKVAFDCELEEDGEHSAMVSDNWIFIDKTGEIVDE